MSELPRQFGHYSLLKMLAKGGMGEIYLARTAGISHFEKYYAIKKLLKKFTNDQDVGARFVDEAKLGARLQHPNIVQVFDLGQQDGELYMATEFVDGFDLRRVLRFCHEKKKRIPLDIALFVVREILSGLAYAHRQLDAEGQSINLIHRDISPQNVLVSFEGEVKIIDFGLAKSTQRSQETQANVLLGNFGYMSPEQARGQPLDVRTDIYSTGIVLFELVTRTKRFVDENPLRLLEMVARPTPVLPSDRAPDVPKRIDHIYTRATSPGRDDRFESAEAFRDEVTTALHKINPHASRENLAQFLNHLFLGGQPPPAPDNDALDKSVAMHVHELYEQAEAFNAKKEDDVQDRRLSQFSDDAPQTGSHALMRACRSGDTLTHAELTGQPPLPNEAEGVAELAPEPDDKTYTGAHPDLMAGQTAQGRSLPDSQAPSPSDELSSAPTSVYEAPAWSGGPTPPPAAAEEAPALSAEAQAPIQPIPQPTERVPAGMVETPGAEAFASTGVEATAAPPAAPLEPLAPSAQTVELELTPLPEPSADPASRPPDPTALAMPNVSESQRGGAVVSTVVGGAERAEPSQEEPTMVVNMDSMPGPDGALGVEVDGFDTGEGSESLIIDFDLADSDESETLPAPTAPGPGGASPLPVSPQTAAAQPPAAGPPPTAARPAPPMPQAPPPSAPVSPPMPPPQPAQPPPAAAPPMPPAAPTQPPPAQPAPQPAAPAEGQPEIRPAAPAGGPVIRPAAQPGRRGKGRAVKEVNPNDRRRR